MLPVALTIAGSDPSGGAGIQADLKTFHQHGVYGAAVITLLTVQDTRGVQRVETMPADLVGAQVDHVVDDLAPAAAKTGALGTVQVVEAIAERAQRWPFPLVVDPVMISKHGAPLVDEAAARAIGKRLLPRARLAMPNLHEASVLSGREVRDLASAREAARAIGDLGPRAVLVKGGHLEGDPIDILFEEGLITEIPGPRVATKHTHGTGCTYSAAIVAGLAQGLSLRDAIVRAKAWLVEALRTAPGVGHGIGPVNHLATLPGSKGREA